MTAAPVPAGPAGELVLSAWTAVSPYGLGSAEFSTGVRDRRSVITALDRAEHPGPFDRGGVVPGFTVTDLLGRKGTRTMDRVTAIAVITVGRLLEACGPELTVEPDRVGLVLGTGSGSVQSTMDFTRDALTGEQPFHVDPARFTNTVMNRAAGQSAIWHGIKGPNTTIAGGGLTGLLALSYAIRLHRGGHCVRVLCGSAEEYSEQRAWLEWRGRGGDGAVQPLGEGSAMFLLEPLDSARRVGRRPLARSLITRFRMAGDRADAGRALADCVRESLDRAGARASDVRVVAPLGNEDELGAIEEAGVRDALSAANPEWIRCRPLIGDQSAASTSMQLAAVLAVAEESWSRSGDHALVTGIDRDGAVGCALLAAPGEERP